MSMITFAKRFLPWFVKELLYRSIWNPARRFLWKLLALEWRHSSGLTTVVESSADWTIYNEIFVGGEYDAAIERLIDLNVSRPLQIVDLGANVGYFVLRCADLLLQQNEKLEFLVTCVEGSANTSEELKNRLAREPQLARNVRVVHGLVGGLRGGEARFSNAFTHYGNGITSEESNTSIVPYVDLEALLQGSGPIDLLKCDIEGAEFELVETYGDLFKRVRYAVFEIHHYGKDVAKLRRDLCDSGLVQVRTIRTAPTFTIELFEQKG